MRGRWYSDALLAALCGLIIAVNGCKGVGTAKEKEAREDLRKAEAVYRPAEEKGRGDARERRGGREVRALPSLTPESGLSDLIHYALLNNPRAESAFYEWRGAVEAITTARSLPDPMLTFDAEIAKGMTALTSTLMTDPAASWSVPGKLSLRADAAYEEAQKRRAVFEGALLGTALAVKRAYYELWVVEQQFRWTGEALAVVEDMEELARERLSVGRVTQQDALRAQIERDRLKTELSSLEDSRTPVAARLRSAMGVGPQETLPAFAVRLEPTSPDFTEQSLLDTAFERNPRLKEMRSEVLQAVSLYHLARKSTVPDVSFGVGGGLSGTALMPSVGVSLPIWRDKIVAEIAQGRAGVQAAEAKLSAEELELAVRFAEAAFAWREADRNVRLYGDRLLPKAKASLDSARAGYATGVSSFLDLLEAERSLLEYHINRAMAVGQREIALAEMSLSILGRWPENVAAILSAAQEAGGGLEAAPSNEGKKKQ